jgi:hypothetical protein
MTTISGYKQDTEGAWIAKDRLARLIYSMDWRHWLPEGNSIVSVDYSHNSRINDAAPIEIHDEGIIEGNRTYVELSGGTLNRIYTITATITLDDGQVDRRAFRIKIQNRIAE